MTEPIPWRAGVATGQDAGGESQAVLLCERASLAEESIRAIHELGAGWAGELPPEVSAWNFADLESPEIRVVAGSRAGQAGLLAVASSSVRPLQNAVRRVLVDALSVRLGRPTALVLLARPQVASDETAHGIVHYLQQIAASGGASFQLVTLPRVDRAAKRDRAAALRRWPPLGIQHWGINE